MDFPAVLDKAKFQRGFASDNALALALGVSRATVSDWRAGKKAPRIENCKKLADFSGFSLTEVHALAEENATPSPTAKRLWRSMAAAFLVSLLVALPAQARSPEPGHGLCIMRS